MRELSLFTGAGGGVLASHLLGITPTHYVEINPYCRELLRARMLCGDIPWAPVHPDVRRFNGRKRRGEFDIVTGGFPCQAFSTAARGRNNAPDLWPEMLRIIDECRPHSVFAENVQRQPIEHAAHDLASRGFRAAITRCSAAGMGAPHRRPRWWLLAHANKEGKRLCAEHAEVARLRCPSGAIWPAPGPEVLGDDDGLACRVDRLAAVGNGQVPAVAVEAFCRLAAGEAWVS